MADEKDKQREALRQQRELDEAAAKVADHLPPLWRRLFINCQSEGFTQEQSMRLVCTFIMSHGTGDKKAPDDA